MGTPTDEALFICPGISIPAADFSFEFSRSGGPGGQHVNTTDTRVRMRFHLERCTAITESVKRRLTQAHPSAVTNSGDYILSCDQHRSRHRNIETVRERLAAWVRDSLKPPKKRRPTKPSKASKRRRVDDKKQRGAVKKTRGRVKNFD
jgi:ribosome-associated protein